MLELGEPGQSVQGTPWCYFLETAQGSVMISTKMSIIQKALACEIKRGLKTKNEKKLHGAALTFCFSCWVSGGAGGDPPGCRCRRVFLLPVW